MKLKNYLIFFGAAGGGRAYSKHTSTKPDFFIDNDNKKWGKKLNGVEIKSPSFLTKEKIKFVSKIIITTGYVKSVKPQLINLGVPEKKIFVPAKSLLGFHPFKTEKNRKEAAQFLYKLMNFNQKMCIVSGGGTALGFCRDSDFINWDFDFDLFASKKYQINILKLLKKFNCQPFIENEEIKAELNLKNGDVIPFSIKFFNPDDDTYDDIYEDHKWVWPSTMFSKFNKVNIHGFLLNVPNPPEDYLNGVYGKNWKIPNPNFGYNDYGK
tara:strand:+ start:1680 stop:2480 length:801 start_codon:yes stop_codon:yes gene_type:complete